MFGKPERLRADYGPAFRESFNNWCKDNAIHRECSSAYHSPSNGLAEAGVARVKKTLKRAAMAKENIEKAMAAYRNTAMVDQGAPAELFFGRSLCGELPKLKKRLPLRKRRREERQREESSPVGEHARAPPHNWKWARKFGSRTMTQNSGTSQVKSAR